MLTDLLLRMFYSSFPRAPGSGAPSFEVSVLVGNLNLNIISFLMSLSKGNLTAQESSLLVSYVLKPRFLGYITIGKINPCVFIQYNLVIL